MPKIWDIKTKETLELSDLIKHLDKKGFDPLANGLEETALMLAKLNNNRKFLCVHLANQIRENSFSKINSYTSQVYVLHANEHYMIRAVIWAPKGSAGDEVYFYEEPHCHNFKLLTLGFYGSGYKTRFFEYSHDDVYLGKRDEINVAHVMDTGLSEGRVIYYMDSHDIHEQHPPEEFSISINIITHPLNQKPQFLFNIDKEGNARKERFSMSSVQNMLGIAYSSLETAEFATLITKLIAKAKSDRECYVLYCSLKSIIKDDIYNYMSQNIVFDKYINDFEGN